MISLGHLNRTAVAEHAEVLAGLDPHDNFAHRQEVAKNYSDETDVQNRLAAFCIITAGTEAPEEYDRQQRYREIVDKALEAEQLIIVGKRERVGRGKTSLEMVVPGGPLAYVFRELSDEESGIETFDGRTLWTAMRIPTWRLEHQPGSCTNKELTHIQTGIFGSDNQVPKEVVSVHDIYTTGARDPYIRIDNSVYLGKNQRLTERSQLKRGPLYGVIAVSELRDVLEQVSLQPVDQLRVIKMLVWAVAELKNTGIYIYGTSSTGYRASSGLRTPEKFFPADRLSAPIAAIIDRFTELAGADTAQTPDPDQDDLLFGLLGSFYIAQVTHHDRRNPQTEHLAIKELNSQPVAVGKWLKQT